MKDDNYIVIIETLSSNLFFMAFDLWNSVLVPLDHGETFSSEHQVTTLCFILDLHCDVWFVLQDVSCTYAVVENLSFCTLDIWSSTMQLSFPYWRMWMHACRNIFPNTAWSFSKLYS